MRMTNFLEGEGASVNRQVVAWCLINSLIINGSMKHVCDVFTCLIKVLLAASGLFDSTRVAVTYAASPSQHMQ